MDAEVIEQRDHHLTVLKKKSSIDQDEVDGDGNMEMKSAIVGMDEIGHQSDTKGNCLTLTFSYNFYQFRKTDNLIISGRNIQ